MTVKGRPEWVTETVAGPDAPRVAQGEMDHERSEALSDALIRLDADELFAFDDYADASWTDTYEQGAIDPVWVTGMKRNLSQGPVTMAIVNGTEAYTAYFVVGSESHALAKVGTCVRETAVRRIMED